MKKKVIVLVIDIIGVILLTALDQLTKYMAVLLLKNGPEVPLIGDALVLQYLENRGAAFGMMQNQKIFFLFMEVVILVVIGYVLAKTPTIKKYGLLHGTLVFLAAGAIGNMIDRMLQDYVVDFIYFKLINFPIFNVADIYVTCATIVFAVAILFYYKEDDFKFLSLNQKMTRDPNYTDSSKKD